MEYTGADGTCTVLGPKYAISLDEGGGNGAGYASSTFSFVVISANGRIVEPEPQHSPWRLARASGYFRRRSEFERE
jgi:hypothetical protein